MLRNGRLRGLPHSAREAVQSHQVTPRGGDGQGLWPRARSGRLHNKALFRPGAHGSRQGKHAPRRRCGGAGRGRGKPLPLQGHSHRLCPPCRFEGRQKPRFDPKRIRAHKIPRLPSGHWVSRQELMSEVCNRLLRRLRAVDVARAPSCAKKIETDPPSRNMS